MKAQSSPHDGIYPSMLFVTLKWIFSVSLLNFCFGDSCTPGHENGTWLKQSPQTYRARHGFPPSRR